MGGSNDQSKVAPVPPAMPGTNASADTTAHYPGDAFVDVVGIDAYTDHVDPEHILGGAALMALNKPFGFAEFGPHAPANPPGDYDYRRLLDGIEKHFPRTVFFLSWDDNWSPHRNRFAKEFFADPRLLNCADLPPLATAGGTPSMRLPRSPD